VIAVVPLWKAADAFPVPLVTRTWTPFAAAAPPFVTVVPDKDAVASAAPAVTVILVPVRVVNVVPVDVVTTAGVPTAGVQTALA
jgi:hypothetical protein